MSYKEELSKKRKELARQYVESEEVNEPVLWELHRLMRPIYYYCLRRYFEDMPIHDIDDFYQLGFITLWKVLEKCREKPDMLNHFEPYLITSVKHAYANEYGSYILKNPVIKVGYEEPGGGYNISSVHFRTDYREYLREKNRKFRDANRARINARRREYWK